MNNKRLVIYFFYDKDGIADRYVDYFLNGLSLVADKFIIVANGKITLATRNIFSKYTDDIIVRENKGFDVWAYKEVLENEGWDKLKSYYEVCLVNSTIMGPVYPFSYMFNEMDKRKDLDFWGVTKFLKLDKDFTGKNPYGYLPEHIQSHFVVYRNSFLNSQELKSYWDKIPCINSYEDSVGKHESYFTKFFEEKGFKWATYTDSSIEYEYNNQPILMSPKNLIQNDKCPIFKRRSFFYFHEDIMLETTGEAAVELYKYLKYHTSYDVDLIWENIIRTVNQFDIWRCLNLNYILPEYQIYNRERHNLKIALIAHLYYMDDVLDMSLRYLSNVPQYIDVYINTPHSEHISMLKEKFSTLPNKVNINLIENRGRDVSSFLVGGRKIVEDYDIVCFYHDKKVSQVAPLSVGRGFAYRTAESALHSNGYIENIIDIFIDNPRLGMLTNIPPYNGTYYWTLGSEWSTNYKNTVELAKELSISVPMSENMPPIAALGTVFWFRTKAMNKIFHKQWQYSDFPAEPNGTDGTLLHAVERLYSFVIQDAGYYPAYVMPSNLASIDLTNFIINVRNTNVSALAYLFSNQKSYLIKNAIKKILPNSVVNLLRRIKNTR